jgi:ABC-type branched-subunit amino acid transport system ATPase component
VSADLVVSGLTVRYGGNVAVDDVSFTAAGSGITGLIGPNGAGKTTTFNACSGLLRPSDGTISLGAKDITSLPVYRRSQLGLGRTFQRMELFESLSVRDNVALGREAGLAGSHPLGHLWSSRRARSEVAQATADAIAVCDIDELADVPVSALSTGQRRLVELARAVAGRSTLLLLDEPSSGLDHAETDRFGDILVRLVDERGVGLLLVEHDMSLVMRVCAHIYVLDFGRLLFEGSAEEVRASDVVREAYLGSAA